MIFRCRRLLGKIFVGLDSLFDGHCIHAGSINGNMLHAGNCVFLDSIRDGFGHMSVRFYVAAEAAWELPLTSVAAAALETSIP
jgi:hypothetical protein